MARRASCPTGRFPTDRDSLISIGRGHRHHPGRGALGPLPLEPQPDRCDRRPGHAHAHPTDSRSPTRRCRSRHRRPASVAPVPTPTPVPLPATRRLRDRARRQSSRSSSPVDTFTPGMTFAHSITYDRSRSARPRSASRSSASTRTGPTASRSWRRRGTSSASIRRRRTAGFVGRRCGQLRARLGPGAVRDADLHRRRPSSRRGQFRLAEG